MYNATKREFAHHQATWGHQKDFGYKDFIPLFRGEQFDADRWVRLFKAAGAKYIMPVAEHHDGFAMYDTAFNRWNATKMGPCVDVMGELKRACEEQGLADGITGGIVAPGVFVIDLLFHRVTPFHRYST
jgi:alpha-L-fucosidase